MEFHLNVAGATPVVQNLHGLLNTLSTVFTIRFNVSDMFLLFYALLVVFNITNTCADLVLKYTGLFRQIVKLFIVLVSQFIVSPTVFSQLEIILLCP